MININMKNLIIYYTIFFQIILKIKCQQNDIPMERSYHTAIVIDKKIYFFGGKAVVNKAVVTTNDFFYLDTSKKINKAKGKLPFINLNNKSLDIPKHYGATTTSFGELKDSIFFFGGDMGNFNNPFELVFSFNTKLLEWKNITISQGMMPERRIHLCATTDNNNKIYLFGGEFIEPKTIDNEINIFDATLNNWTIGKNGPLGRKGYTATFLPKTKEIIYIGGYGENAFASMTNVRR
jgi:N-acetylneuraminic acid mutarotase